MTSKIYVYIVNTKETITTMSYLCIDDILLSLFTKLSTEFIKSPKFIKISPRLLNKQYIPSAIAHFVKFDLVFL